MKNVSCRNRFFRFFSSLFILNLLPQIGWAINLGAASTNDTVLALISPVLPASNAPAGFPNDAGAPCSAVKICDRFLLSVMHCHGNFGSDDKAYQGDQVISTLDFTSPGGFQFFFARAPQAARIAFQTLTVIQPTTGADGLLAIQLDQAISGTNATLPPAGFYPGDEVMTAVGYGKSSVDPTGTAQNGMGIRREGTIQFNGEQVYPGDPGTIAAFGPGPTGQFTLPADSGGGVFTSTGVLYGLVLGPSRNGGNPNTDPNTTVIPLAPNLAWINQQVAAWCPAPSTSSAPPSGNCVCQCTGGATAIGPISQAPGYNCANVNGDVCGSPYCSGSTCSGTAFNCHQQ